LPQEVAEGMPCLFTASPTQPYLASGVLDLSVGSYGYRAEFLVGNQMAAQANSQQLMSETSTVTLQGAVVRITNAAGQQLTTFTNLTSGTIYPATGDVPGYVPTSAEIVDAQTLKTDPDITSKVTNGNLPLNQRGIVRLVTYTRFFGYTLGGRYVESNEFEFPVDVCFGCLVVRASSCGATNASEALPCVIGQDLELVEPCEDAGTD
jgi:hypothetical protein